MPGRKLKTRMDPERADDIREKPKNVRISEHASSRSREGLSAPEFIVILLFSPLAGLIGFLVWHGKKPRKARQSLTIAAFMFLFYMIIFLF
ncbi:hypothetical protein DNK57_08625 [Methanothermobacter thermautotrophicus]|uniref:Uncharacterized protein n=1 Tax=Methanothermobacter thermautotrophicus TaxID=145262 RepID=A0A842YPB2_METTF|nr:hypothetical protein [Methanothermobacter thermautotrophicus]MBE2900848.1 hypothetical protein [Methanothermobacter thermautotrophicus]